LNKDFWHQTVTTKQVESYISKKAGIDLSKVFDQYLRDTRIPTLLIEVKGTSVSYRYENVVEGFEMPLRIKIDGREFAITPTTRLQKLIVKRNIKKLAVDRNFYVNFLKRGPDIRL